MDPRVRQLFRSLLYMGKEYPAESGGYLKFSQKLKRSFRSTPGATPEEVDRALEKGQYVIKGMYDNSNSGGSDPAY